MDCGVGRINGQVFLPDIYVNLPLEARKRRVHINNMIDKKTLEHLYEGFMP